MEAALATMQTLATEAGLHWSSVSRWRKGDEPSPETALKLATALRERALPALDAACRLEAEARALLAAEGQPKTTEEE